MASKGKISEIVDVEAVKAQLKVLNDGVSLAATNIEKVTGEAIKLNASFKDAKGIKELTESYVKLNKVQNDNAIAQEKLKQQTIATEKKQVELDNAIKKTTTSTTKVVDEWKKLNDAYSSAAREAKNLGIQFGQNSKQFTEASEKAKELKAQITSLNQSTGVYTDTVGNYEIATKSLKLELREYIAALAQMKREGKDNTEEYQKLLKTTGELQDTIADTREEVKRYASDTQSLDMAIGVFKGIGSAAQVAEGAIQLFGTESEEVQRGIQKMVALQGVLNGVQEIGNALQKESSFMMGVTAVKTKVMAAAQYVYTTAVGTSTGAMKAFKVALLATGIGALIVGLGYLAEKMGVFGDSTEEAATNVDLLKESLDEMSTSTEKQITIGNKYVELLKAQGKSTQEIFKYEKEILNFKNLSLIKQIAFLEAASRTAEEEKKLSELKLQREMNSIDLQILEMNYNKKASDDKKKNLKEIEEAAKKQAAELKKIEDEKLDDEEGTTTERLNNTEILINNFERKAKKEKSLDDEVTDLILQNSQEQTDAQLLSIDTVTEADKKAAEKRQQIREASFNGARDVLGAIGQLTQISYDKDLALIDEKSKADNAAKEAELKAAGNNQELKDKINAKYAAKEKQQEKERKKIEAEKAKANKQTAIFNTILDTAQAIVSHLKTPWLIPFDILTGALQLAVIQAQPIPKYKHGRKGGEAELAVVGDGGTEGIQLASGERFLTPNKDTLTYLPKGASVIPNYELYKNSAFDNIPEYNNSFNMDLQQLGSKIENLQSGFVMVANTIQNKKETHWFLDNGEWRCAIKNGASIAEYYGQKLHG